MNQSLLQLQNINVIRQSKFLLKNINLNIKQDELICIVGKNGSGKTTLCTHIISECQAKGGLCAIIDAEQAFDKEYATKLGVNVDELDINQPDCGEEALEVADTLIKSGAYDVIVVDSVAALVPRKELEGDMGDANMGLHARLMSQAMRKLTASVKKNNVLLYTVLVKS